jgi:predicted dehydrogenase
MPIRLAMLGMWHTHADGLVRQIAEHPREFTLVGCYDRDAEIVAQRRAPWQRLLANLRVFDRPEALLREELDGVVVEGRVFENVRLAQLALEHGKPVLLEKPAGDNLHDYRQLIDQAQRKDLPSYDRFVEELAPYRGGMFFEMAGHVIDMMIAMLGVPRQVTPFLAHHHRHGPVEFIDNGVAVFGYPNAWASVEVPALEVAPHARRLEVFGTEGALVIPHLGSGHLANRNIQPIEVFRRGHADWQTIELPASTLQISDLREFAAVIAGRKRPDFDMQHDLAVQETLLRASGMLVAPGAPL